MADKPISIVRTSAAESLSSYQGGDGRPLNVQSRKLGLFLIVLSLCYSPVLFLLGKFAVHSEFFSYIPLIPVISGYLIWQKKADFPQRTRGAWVPGIILAVIGLCLAAGCYWQRHRGWQANAEDYLTVMVTSYFCFILAGCLAFLGTAVWKVIAFPAIFLVFMVPIPSGMLESIESFFQLTSAWTASAMLTVAGTPVYRNYLTLELPGFALVVAPECSGIHSTMVLLITAALAGHLFIDSKWKRLLLILFVIPLAIARNGFRVFVLGELSIHIGHWVMDSPLHHRGGPIFFVLSLIPFFLLLYYLRKYELRARKAVNKSKPGQVD